MGRGATGSVTEPVAMMYGSRLEISSQPLPDMIESRRKRISEELSPSTQH